jgi:GNAT superfamily N-acetyltransferase
VTTYLVSIDDAPGSELPRMLADGLTQHALPYTGVPGFQPLAAVLRDGGGALVGGAYGNVNWTWLSIGLVWVAEPLRRGGYGRQVISALEDAARARGCRHAHLDTFSYQARPFYERLGYELFATLDDYPPGHQRYFLKKRLL